MNIDETPLRLCWRVETTSLRLVLIMEVFSGNEASLHARVIGIFSNTRTVSGF